jgi:DNA-binding PadR family transcriptional regulator
MTNLQQLRKGSTPLLILSILNEGPQHGYGIMRAMEQRSEGYFSMTAALLYPALHQMELDGLVSAEWQNTIGNRRKKIYSITPKGKEYLMKDNLEWHRFFDYLFGIIDQQGIKRAQ